MLRHGAYCFPGSCCIDYPANRFICRTLVFIIVVYDIVLDEIRLDLVARVS